MTAARGLGFGRPEAARFSFLLSIPANGAASVLVIGDALQSGGTITGAVILTGVLTFFVALGTITVLMRMVRYVSFLPFAIYRVVLGLVVLSLTMVGPQSLWGLLGLIPLVTGLVGTCPLYAMFGVSTCPAKTLQA